jgi:hypothetical protein
MPLINSASREALSSNISAERASGKSEAQSVAIGLSVQRRARRKGTLTAVKKRRRRESEAT